MKKKGGNLKRVKKQNSRLIKEIIYKNPLITRTEIAEQLAVSLPTVTTMVNQLLEQGVLVEKPQLSLSGELGRKPVPLEIVGEHSYFIGIELRPYDTTICIIDLSGKLILQQKFLPVCEIYNEMLEQLTHQIRKVVSNSTINSSKIAGIGIGLPGIIHSEKGEIYRCEHKQWQGQRLANDLSQHVDLPVVIENNVRVRAIAVELVGINKLQESLFNQDLEKSIIPDNFAYLYVSAGIACSLSTRGSVYKGYQAGAGELGHTVIIPDGPVCEVCGKHGCLDAVASERVILKEYSKTHQQNLNKPKHQVTMKEVLASFRQEDKATKQIISTAVKYIGIALANIINFISPEVVYIDGYIFQEKEIKQQILEVTRHNLYGKEDLEILFIPYHSFGGAISAAYYGVKCFFIEGKI